MNNNNQNMLTVYHFTDGNTLRNGDPIPKIGKWLKHKGDIIPCESGLHGSEHPSDALYYAPGSMLHLCELRGDLQSHDEPVDKWVGRERKILKSIDATSLLMEYARWCALQVIHLWKDAPQVVLDYLKTGDENLKEDAWDATLAAQDAAWYAAWDAARDAALGAARAVAWGAARGAARSAALGAARSAALGAARGAAWALGEGGEKIMRDRFKEMVDGAF